MSGTVNEDLQKQSDEIESLLENFGTPKINEINEASEKYEKEVKHRRESSSSSDGDADNEDKEDGRKNSFSRESSLRSSLDQLHSKKYSEPSSDLSENHFAVNRFLFLS